MARGAAAYNTRQQRQIISDAARRHGISASVLWGLYGAESNFGRNTNNSSAGAQGPFQFMPGTARSYGINPQDFKQSANAAAKYLSTYWDRGVSGALAAYNAGPAGNPNNPETRAYIPKVKQLAQGFKDPGGSSGSGGSSTTQTTSGYATSGTAPVAEPQDSALTTLLLTEALKGQEKPQIQSQGVQAPGFSARPVLSQAGQVQAPSSVPSTPKRSLADQLAIVRGLQGSEAPKPVGGQTQTVTGTTTSESSSSSGGKTISGRSGSAVGKPGKLIGTPHAGTHTLGNWQSDRAIDIGTPRGTPILATEDGVIRKTGGQKSEQGRFGGFSVTVNGRNDNYFYAHLSRLTVKPGQKVKRGQVIGYSGAANGVEHLHFGRERGDPRRNQ